MSRIPRKLSPQFPIHITGRRNNREIFPISMPEAWEVFSDYLFAIHQRHQIQVCSFVLMPNHFHLICLDPKSKLPSAMALFMKETCREINHISERQNRLWGNPYFSSVISSPIYYLHAYKYVYRNPVAAGICRKVEEYPWSTIPFLLGERRGIIPLLNDDTLFSSIDSTLRWLNETYDELEAKALKLAFQKKVFEIPVETKTKRKNPLLEFDSFAVNCEMLRGTFNVNS